MDFMVFLAKVLIGILIFLLIKVNGFLVIFY